jgi:hypothetical protein
MAPPRREATFNVDMSSAPFEGGEDMNKVSKFARLARHWVWLMPLVVGIAFAVGGGYMMLEGRNAHDDVRDNIVREEITISDDAAEFAGERVDSAAKADAQADVILEHTLASTGGYLYAQMGQFFMPEGTYMLPEGTFATASGGVTEDLNAAATDENGDPIRTTTDVAQAAKNSSDQPVRAWTSDRELAAKDANGSPVPNALRTTAQTSAFLRTSLGVAVMGFKVSDLVVALGAFLVFLGVMQVLIMAPVTYWATVVADEHERTAGEKAGARGRQTTSQPG